MLTLNDQFDSYVSAQSQIALWNALAGISDAGKRDGTVPAPADMATVIENTMNQGADVFDTVDIGAAGARLSLLELQQSAASMYDSLLSGDSGFARLIGGTAGTSGGSASGFFSGNSIIPDLDMFTENPKAAIASQANANARSVLDLFS